MIPRSDRFRHWMGGRFDGMNNPALYLEACDHVPEWIAENNEGFLAFTEELATHIRESSYPPPRNETQWSIDEELRSIYYDIMGPADAPGDPYPVPPEQWGRVRLTWYMLHGVDDEPEWSSPGATAWLTRRGLTHQGVYEVRAAQMQNVRPQPSDYLDHLERLTAAGLREPQPGEPSYQAS